MEPHESSSRGAPGWVLIGIAIFCLIFVLYPLVAPWQRPSPRVEAMALMNNLFQAVEAYQIENGRLPDKLDQLAPRYYDHPNMVAPAGLDSADRVIYYNPAAGPGQMFIYCLDENGQPMGVTRTGAWRAAE